MGVWYYGVIKETDDEIVVMYVGKGLHYPEEAVAGHIEYAKAVMRALDEAGEGLGAGAVELLDGAVRNLREAYSPELLFYVMLCLRAGIEPRVVSEYELFDEIEGRQGKKVVVLGEE